MIYVEKQTHMHNNHLFYTFNSVLTNRFCDHVIKYGTSLESIKGITGEEGEDRDIRLHPLSKKEEKTLSKTRDSHIVWMNDKWIYKEIHPYIEEANKITGWNFQWDYSESMQFTKYSKGQFYDWHIDSLEEVIKNRDSNHNGKNRKLSVTCNLSNEDDYGGGELQFCHIKKGKIKINTLKAAKGSIIVFPSFVWHRVKPVMSGERYSLVVWNLGYPFK